MIVILAEPADGSAHWLGDDLARRGTTPVRTITPRQLTYARSAVHLMSAKTSSARFVLASGETLDFAGVSGVINRVGALPTDHFQALKPSERDYASAELHAFMLGVLASLPCRVINPPAPEALSGTHHGAIEALQFAAQAGLPCRPVNALHPVADGPEPGGTSHFILGNRLVGRPCPAELRDRLLQFASWWGGDLLQVDLNADMSFRGARSFVDFRLGGPALAGAIARALAP